MHRPQRKQIVVLGSNFAGLTAALELKDALRIAHDVTVVTRADQFVFTPALLQIPFGPPAEPVGFDLKPLLADRGIAFRRELVTRLDPTERRVLTRSGDLSYDFLVIATGARPNYAAIPGLGPRGYSHSILSPLEAGRAAEGLARLALAPGPVVLGMAPGGSCFWGLYEFALRLVQWRSQHGLTEQVPVTLVTPEPFAGHAGVGGVGSTPAFLAAALKAANVEVITDAAIVQVLPSEVRLANGRPLPFSFGMILPPFLGADAVRATGMIANASGFITVNGSYQSPKFREVFAAGIAVATDPTEPTQVPCGAARGGELAEEMARVVAHNISALIKGERMVELRPASIEARAILEHTREAQSAPSAAGGWCVPGPERRWAISAWARCRRLAAAARATQGPPASP